MSLPQKKKTDEQPGANEELLLTWMVEILNSMFQNSLAFQDTHKRRDIAPPQLPDISVTHPEHYVNTQTVLAVVELKDRPLDSSAFGQVINAVRLVHLKLLQKRDIWGFVLNATDKNFVFHLQEDGGKSFAYFFFFFFHQMNLSLCFSFFNVFPKHVSSRTL